MKHKILKVVLIGPENIGKTELQAAIVERGVFNEDYKMTIGGDFYTWSKEDKKTTTLQVWDTAGQERFLSMSTPFLKGAEVICVVWDGTKPIDKTILEKWVAYAKENAPDAEIRLVINKTDAEGFLGEDVLRAQIDGVYPHESPFKEIHFCSAKTKDRIDQLRDSLVEFTDNLFKSKDKGADVSLAPPTVNLPSSSSDPILSFFLARSLRLLGTSNAVRNSFLVALLGVVGMVVLGALGGPLSLNLFSGLMVLAGSVAALGAALTLLCTVFAWIKYSDALENNDEYSLPVKFAQWIKTHPAGFGVGVALFLGGIALMVMAIAFPGALAGVAFFAAPISFVAGSLSGIGLVGTPAALMAIGMLTVAAITVWDALCRIGNALFFDDGAPFKRERAPLQIDAIDSDDDSITDNKTMNQCPFYQRGMGLKNAGNYIQAIEGFQTSIKNKETPNGEAEFQLAGVYELHYGRQENNPNVSHDVKTDSLKQAGKYYTEAHNKGYGEAQGALNTLLENHPELKPAHHPPVVGSNPATDTTGKEHADPSSAKDMPKPQ